MPNLSPKRQSSELVALGNAIRRLRQARGMSQEQLALQAGADRSHFGRLERGDNEIAILLLVRIAKALHITVAELITEAGL